MALGADAVGMCSAIEITLGCHTCFSCQSGKCTLGITSQDPKLTAKLIPDTAGQRVANFLAETKEEIKTLTMLSGHGTVKELGLDDVRALSVDASAISGAKLIGLEEPLFPLKTRIE